MVIQFNLKTILAHLALLVLALPGLLLPAWASATVGMLALLAMMVKVHVAPSVHTGPREEAPQRWMYHARLWGMLAMAWLYAGLMFAAAAHTSGDVRGFGLLVPVSAMAYFLIALISRMTKENADRHAAKLADEAAANNGTQP